MLARNTIALYTFWQRPRGWEAGLHLGLLVSLLDLLWGTLGGTLAMCLCGHT